MKQSWLAMQRGESTWTQQNGRYRNEENQYFFTSPTASVTTNDISNIEVASKHKYLNPTMKYLQFHVILWICTYAHSHTLTLQSLHSLALDGRSRQKETQALLSFKVLMSDLIFLQSLSSLLSEYKEIIQSITLYST